MHEGSHAAVLPVPVRCKGNRREVNGIVVVSVQHKLVARSSGAIVVADDTVVLETVEEVSRSTVAVEPFLRIFLQRDTVLHKVG